MRTPGSVVFANPTALNKEAKRKREKLYLYDKYSDLRV